MPKDNMKQKKVQEAASACNEERESIITLPFSCGPGRQAICGYPPVSAVHPQPEAEYAAV